MAQTPYLCIGGPFDGQKKTYDEVRGQHYTSFNCSGWHPRSKHALARAKSRGEVTPPSSVLIHATRFGE